MGQLLREGGRLLRGHRLPHRRHHARGLPPGGEPGHRHRLIDDTGATIDVDHAAWAPADARAYLAARVEELLDAPHGYLLPLDALASNGHSLISKIIYVVSALLNRTARGPSEGFQYMSSLLATLTRLSQTRNDDTLDEGEAMVAAAAARGVWIDQAQSLNLFMREPSGRKLDELYRMAWLKGLKTTYYLRTQGATRAEKSTGRGGELNAVSASVPMPKPSSAQAFDVNADAGAFCSLDEIRNGTCEACQ